MLKEGFVDEMRIFVAPIIVGGKEATSLAEGDGIKKMVDGFKFKLINAVQRDNYVVLKYIRA